VHDASGAAVANASVYLRGGDAFAPSGIDGFELKCTASGDVTPVVVHAGFRAFEQRISLLSEVIAIQQ
jgi:hypothetical protein